MEAEVKRTSFSDLIEGDIPVLVDFYTDWCGPCKTIAPIIKSVKSSFGDTLHVIKIDAEKNADAAIRYQVRGVPTLILFHKGNILWQQAGVVQEKQLEQIIKSKIQG